MQLPDYVSLVLFKFLKEESGAPLIEYVLIASLITVVSWLFIMALNKNI